jgi:hypothetical protein
MILPNQVRALMQNWGDKAQALDCLAYTRFYDPLSSWECYIYAVNPEDPDEILCIIHGEFTSVEVWNIKALFTLFNAHGENLLLDQEYVAQNVRTILNNLARKHGTYSR